MAIDRILVPVDFSQDSAAAVEQAIEFARVFDAEIDLIHVYQIGTLMPYDSGAYPEELIESLRNAAMQRIQGIDEEVRAAGIQSRIHLSHDVPSHAIVAAAEELSSDLIVMGTRGLTGLKHVLLGSVAERTVRHAPCSVLTVKQPVA